MKLKKGHPPYGTLCVLLKKSESRWRNGKAFLVLKKIEILIFDVIKRERL